MSNFILSFKAKFLKSVERGRRFLAWVATGVRRCWVNFIIFSLFLATNHIFSLSRIQNFNWMERGQKNLKASLQDKMESRDYKMLKSLLQKKWRLKCLIALVRFIWYFKNSYIGRHSKSNFEINRKNVSYMKWLFSAFMYLPKDIRREASQAPSPAVLYKEFQRQDNPKTRR